MNEDNIKEKIENICNTFFLKFAEENDSKLNDGGGFANSENFYEWNDNAFVINFF